MVKNKHLKQYAKFLEPSKKINAKIWPKEGQQFSKSKKFKIFIEDKKNYNKITTFC